MSPVTFRQRAQMILNHKAAIELLVSNADVIGFDRYTIMNLHSSLAYGLLENEEDDIKHLQYPQR